MTVNCVSFIDVCFHRSRYNAVNRISADITVYRRKSSALPRPRASEQSSTARAAVQWRRARSESSGIAIHRVGRCPRRFGQEPPWRERSSLNRMHRPSGATRFERVSSRQACCTAPQRPSISTMSFSILRTSIIRRRTVLAYSAPHPRWCHNWRNWESVTAEHLWQSATGQEMPSHAVCIYSIA